MHPDNTGSVTNKYIRGINLIYAEDGTDRKWYLFNGHGDVIQLTGNDGNVTKDYDYDAFGNERNPDANDNNPFRYSGEYFDKETGTIYLRARYYNPEIGRFISEDSYWGKDSDPLSLNLYTYVNNNPVLYIDLTGNSPIDVTRTLARWLIGNPVNAYVTQHPGWLTQKLFYAAGFARDSGGVYHARQDALQQYGGYNDFYDTVFHYATSMDKAKFQFSYDSKEYIFWGWKGNYLNLGAGAEMGIYTRLVINGTPTDHWIVDTRLALPMTLTLKDNKGNTIVNYKPSEKQWWVTGFNPYYQDVKAGNLTATYTINFSSNKGMYNKFYDTWSKDDRWKFDKETHTAMFKF